jgi:23S rRNA (cytidine2498-2'-O)-methyltransferase
MRGDAAGDAPAARPTGMTGYLAAEGYLDELLAEVGPAVEIHGRLALVPGPARPAAWAANVWHDVLRLEVPSVKAAARALRALQRNWALYASGLYRRAALIEAELPKVSAKPLAFPAPAPSAPLGSWTLVDATTVLAAQRCSSPFPNGEAAFVEDKSGPPNRAYLKLWEALTLLGRHPRPGERCLDLGASPGGWTWALQGLGAQVLAVDKAPLAPAIAALPNVEFMKASAFALQPADVEPVDWLVSDVVCYPDRLYRLVETWLASGRTRNMVCTVKFQGATDMAAVRRFAALPGSRLLHLHHNKHELTWMWPA